MDCLRTLETPIGFLTIACTAEAVTGVYFPGSAPEISILAWYPLLDEAANQLKAYFEGRLTRFDLPLAPSGTAFQKQVWRALTDIPYGETRTYGEIAAAVGNPRASRAVGMANHRNPIPILIPCHRVIGKSGTLTGYAGGLGVKEYLLRLERGEGAQ